MSALQPWPSGVPCPDLVGRVRRLLVVSGPNSFCLTKVHQARSLNRDPWNTPCFMWSSPGRSRPRWLAAERDASSLQAHTVTTLTLVIWGLLRKGRTSFTAHLYCSEDSGPRHLENLRAESSTSTAAVSVGGRRQGSLQLWVSELRTDNDDIHLGLWGGVNGTTNGKVLSELCLAFHLKWS